MFTKVNIPWLKSKVSLKGKKNRKVNSAVHSEGCTHDFQFVQDRKIALDSPGTFDLFVLGYCPLCKATRVFAHEDWEAIKKIQEIQKKY